MSTNKKVQLPYGEGSIYYVKSRGKYAGQICFNVEGKTVRKTVYGNTANDAKFKLRELQIQVAAGNISLVKKQPVPTIHQYAERMMDEQLALNEIRQSSYDRKVETLKRLASISSKKVNEVSEDDIIRFFAEQLEYSQSYIDKMYQLLGAVFKRAVRKKLIDVNPLADIRRPKSKQKSIPVRALTVSEQQKLLKVLKSEPVRYSNIMLLSMFTGMRTGECSALMVEDIDLDAHTISVNKTLARGKFGNNVLNDTKTSAGTRTLKVNDEVNEFLRACIGDKTEGMLFLSSNGNLVSTSQVNSFYTEVLKKHNIIDTTIYGRVDLHSLRHTYATRCIEAGMPAKVLQTILGHSDINITLNTYCSVFEKFSQEHLVVADKYMKANHLSIA